ncbi:hypothetical protein TTHERM_00058960 (macronuclear) [Tetrahymena thermophila SB210]|uniref:Uncharacterized protein n=1 Tax=Tetrahymena thermophila (strain SB210) TaxID=312017 RepID=I7MDD6_TETTS|nr:hypothetical protein TTHERM_00058960 [Tetrahymena thermophila SB210]EAR87384.1 hypothetical protein TTHERM_00058960 [Tetrahymena thermophila SB210]|eukprot:XP_001007629.1 hypothetical protein TTHERM_00058960 [Tetrahymena thermophila SB210]
MLKESTKQNICNYSDHFQNVEQSFSQSQQQNCQNNKGQGSPTLIRQNQTGIKKITEQIKKSIAFNQVQSVTSAYSNPQKKLSESVNEKSNQLSSDLNSSQPIPLQRKGRSQKSKMQEQLNEATKSLQAFRDKSNELQIRQNNLKVQYNGLSEKRKKFDQEIGDFTLNSKQLQEYTSEVQKDLKKVSQNQKEVVQDTKENLQELLNQLLQYRDQRQIMELLGDAISQKDQILKRIIESTQKNQSKELEQVLQQKELEKLLQESSQSIEDLDRKIIQLTIENQQLSQSIKEKADKINELILKLSEKDQLEANLRNQICELNQKQLRNESELFKIQERQLVENFQIKEKTYQQRIQMLESQLNEKTQSELELRQKIVDLENEIKKYQKLGKQTEILNAELKDVLLHKQSEIEQLKVQIDNIHQLHEQGHQEFRSKLTQKIKQCIELQSEASSSPEDKKNSILSSSSHKLIPREEQNLTNQSFDRPTSKSQHIQSTQSEQSNKGVKTDITQIEKESQMNQIFNELKIFNEQTSKPTLSQMKLKTLTNVQITPIVSTIKSNYMSRDTSAECKQASQSYISVNVANQNIQGSSQSSSSILQQNPNNLSQISQNTQSYHPPLSMGGNTAQYLQNRVVPNQKFVFKHPHHPQKIIEMSPISRQSSVQSTIYLMKQSNVSSYGQGTPNTSNSLIKKI